MTASLAAKKRLTASLALLLLAISGQAWADQCRQIRVFAHGQWTYQTVCEKDDDTRPNQYYNPADSVRKGQDIFDGMQRTETEALKQELLRLQIEEARRKAVGR